MQSLQELLESAVGIGADKLSVLHILVRSLLIYIIGIALVRLGKKRFLGKISAFDTVLAIIIGSLLSRAITDSDYFLHILAACLLLILLHRVFSLVAAYSDDFGALIKGNDRVILRNGELLHDAMKKSNLSEQDVIQSLRLNGNTDDVSKIRIARIERNGDISVIMKEEN
ncbi:DUF421 domain-containing protein [Rufibacter glacialis]|uniref:DUF421 domain-containing protein n=1 Tax=Rufibacter glacialis TaxID=1259555 RepID=A0A5M8QQ15_9BACT|nr:YetF domain-containing protein [Rufibacter glacialis]KAA6438169.1 DUF421 domain-containing protein [Rufibacter glacialis]GGK89196.1 hypothetical protein GCM10011405_41170 [Rufibacter glacialis]